MTIKKYIRVLLSGVLAFFVLACGVADASDSVGLIDMQKIMLQHPRFDEASKVLLFVSRPLEGPAVQILAGERDPERRAMITKYSAQITELAQMDRAIAAENDPQKKRKLWEDRQKKLAQFEGSLMRPILEDCEKAIKAVMTRLKITVVVDITFVYHGGRDITDEVIQQLKSGRR